VKLHLGDCLDILRTIPNNTIDSVVTDPPYGLKFMGKKWDYDVPKSEIWAEVLRVLKPGGHALIACGTRTQHRMAVNIEDAGFEIRDVISYLYGSGFPKSLNIKKASDKMGISCDCKQTTKSSMRPVQESDLSSAFYSKNEQGQILQPSLSEQSSSETVLRPKSKKRSPNGKEPCLEGWSNLQTQQRELHRPEVCEMSEGISSDGSQGQLHYGTSASNGDALRSFTSTNRGSSSQGPQHKEQSDRKLGIVPQQSVTQTCGSCGKTVFLEGFGTALKPACEFWTLARKPLSEKTVAANVQKWGTGGINIDGCRVGTEIIAQHQRDFTNAHGNKLAAGTKQPVLGITNYTTGRFPANLILDEQTALMLDEQSGNLKCPGNIKPSKKNAESSMFGISSENKDYYGDSGGASRFFYCAKASKSERNAGLDSLDLIWESEAWLKPDLRLLVENISQLSRDISEDQSTDDTQWSTDLYGHSISEQYPKGMIFTIETVLKLITDFRTWNVSPNFSINASTQDAIRTIEANGLNLAESVAFINQLDLSTTREKTAYLLGVARAVLPMLLQIRGFAKSQNFHSTVKPIKLMAYLCRLITPPQGIVLDPFMGSGSTGVACTKEGFDFTGIEMNAEYFEIASKRLEV